jgi:Tfp pilus assembly protein PilN
MSDWTFWATFLAMGTGAAIVATYLLCRARIEETRNRILVLEREIALTRMREHANEKKLAKILEAVTSLRELTEEQLGQLRAKLEGFIAHGFPHESAP